MDVVDRELVDDVDDVPQPRPGRAGRWLPLVLAVLALACAAALPFLPVRMSMPTVSWPQDPQRPASTMVELTNQQPLALDVRFSCAAVAEAGATADGVLLATLVPGQQVDPPDGLQVTVRDGVLRVVNRGITVLEETPPSGQCGYRVRGTPEELVVERDGTVVGTDRTRVDPDGVLPDVDVLATSLTSLGSADDLSVRLTVDDQFNTTPTAVKQVLVVALLLCVLGSLVALRRRNRAAVAGRRRGVDRPPRRRPDPLVVLVDVLVVGTMFLWLFLAPLSDDDGYYAAMARNASAEGFVGNYYQLMNQAFTPFTWLYRVLGWWEDLGNSPTLLRIPALVAGLATWALLRRYVTRPGTVPADVARSPWGRRCVQLFLGAAFLAWWLPYGMGVRPEAIVGLLALVSMASVMSALRRRQLFPVAVAVGAASLALCVHPTGFVAFGPLLVALPGLARLVRSGATWFETLLRSALILAPAALASAAAFADGSLNDFLRGQQIFLSIQDQNSWVDEYQRYFFLLSPNPMGSYARRTAVLLGIAALVWFLVVAVAARARAIHLPAPLVLAGQSLGAAFFLLWLTPSKWTHHFGALAGIGPAFLALFLASVPVLVRRLLGDRRTGPWIPFLVLGTAVVVAALTFTGPNQFAYSWLPGMPHAFVPPFVSVVRLGSPLVWAVAAALVLAALGLYRRRTGRPHRAWPVAVPALVLVFLATSLVYLLGSFGYATVRTLDGYSPWADALTDPLAKNCGAARGVDVFDISAAVPVAPLPDPPAPAVAAPFVSGGGWATDGQPAVPVGQGVASQVWGSLPSAGQEDLTGTMASPWYRLPTVPDGQVLTALASGRLDDGNALTVQYAAATPGGEPRVVGSQPLTDSGSSPAWRTFVLDPGTARGDGAGMFRLVAADHSGGPGGWLAFTGPSILPVVPLESYLPKGAPVAVAWQFSFLFPCQRQPVVRFGITEPAQYGVVWRNGATDYGLLDNTWQVSRGGLFAPVQRTSAVTELGVVLPGQPEVRNVEVFRFLLPYQVHGYDLSVERTTRWGWTGPPIPRDGE